MMSELKPGSEGSIEVAKLSVSGLKLERLVVKEVESDPCSLVQKTAGARALSLLNKHRYQVPSR